MALETADKQLIAKAFRTAADTLDPATSPPATGGGTTPPVTTPPVTTPPVTTPPTTTPGAGGTQVGTAFTGRSVNVDSGWNKSFEDDFPNLCAEAKFLSTYGKWSAYPINYLTTAGQQSGSQKGDHYGVDNISVIDTDGLRVLNCRMRPKSTTPDGKNWGAAPYPAFSIGQGTARAKNMKLEMRVRVPDGSSGWHPANLIWFDDVSWPGGGEIDFWEQSGTGTIGAYFHYKNGKDGGDQAHFETGVKADQWHVIGFEWLSGTSYKQFLDGKQVGNTITSRVPDAIGRLVLQNEPDGAPTKDCNIQYDWITVWTK